MNAEQLLKHYERIADAPDAIARLRHLIIALAVRGKLVQQNRADAAATDLLEATWDQKGATPKNTRSTPRKSTVVGRAEQPFDLPDQWSFARLGGVLEMINGRAFKPGDWIPAGLPIVRIQNLNNPAAPYNYCDPKTVDNRHLIRDGEFLISWSGTPGTSFGAFIWTRGPAALNQHIFRCIQRGRAFMPEFLKLAINSQLDVLIAQAQGGVGLQHVTKGTLEALPLPLPPLPEQHRIVAKVDELMALCDRLEAARAQREATRDRLAAASLARLNTPDPDSETVKAHARFAIGTTLPALTTRPDQIKKFRQTVLNLAVRGLLVPTGGTDESVSKLLTRILEESPSKASPKHQQVIEAPYSIPACWEWTTLGQLIVDGPQNGLSPKPTNREDAPKAITLTATTSGTFDPSHFKRVEAMVPDDSDLWLREGDLLFQRGNTREYVGMAAIYTGPPRTYLFPDLMIRVRVSEHLNLRFIHLAAIAPPARQFLSENAAGAQLTMPKINQSTLVSLPIPLPPRSVQNRIVAKVDQLMSLCDQLEASLTRGEATRRRLLEALLHDALQPSRDNVIDLEAARQRLLEKREAVACRSVQRLSRTKGFGRTKAVKALYFAEAHCGIALGGQWGRGNFGPYDHWILSFESHAAREGWLSCRERPASDGGTRVEYTSGPRLSAKTEVAAQVLGDQAPEFERILTLLAELNTDESEIVATLYAAWNDLLLEGKPVSDDIVITEFREQWGFARKADFAPALLRRWLDWMREHQLAPQGRGPSTRHQGRLIERAAAAVVLARVR
ncbi:MAG: restriction endonuclease subunit S, partial [Pseudomonadota bacterium]